MRRVQTSIWAGLALALAACNEPGELYQRPAAEVHDLLRTVEVPLYMLGSNADTRASVDASDPSKVVWKVRADDSPLMTFTATLIAEGAAKTRVIVDVEGSKQGRFGDMQAKLAKAREIRALYLVSMVEAVDSTLDGRAYDITVTYGAMLTAATANADRMFPPSSVSNASEPPGNVR